MTAGGERGEGERGEQDALAARGAPVDGAAKIEAKRDERAEQEQEAVAHEPHVTEARLERDARERRRLDRGRPARLERGGLMGEDDGAERQREPHERPRERLHAGLPCQGGRAVRSSGEDKHRGAADDEDGRAQVDEARDETELGHSQSKLSVTGFAKRRAAGPIVLRVAAPRVSVSLIVSSGRVTSAP